MISRNEALALLAEHGVQGGLLRHSLASEAVMRALAGHFDVDYPVTESAPERHGRDGATLLAGKLPEEACIAIEAHNAECTGRQPQSRFDYALRCGETVTGIIAAAALLRPTGYDGMEPKSIKKKMKDKAFAASVNRTTIKECALAGLDLDAFLALAISAMAAMPAAGRNAEHG